MIAESGDRQPEMIALRKLLKGGCRAGARLLNKELHLSLFWDCGLPSSTSWYECIAGYSSASLSRDPDVVRPELCLLLPPAMAKEIRRSRLFLKPRTRRIRRKTAPPSNAIKKRTMDNPTDVVITAASSISAFRRGKRYSTNPVFQLRCKLYRSPKPEAQNRLMSIHSDC